MASCFRCVNNPFKRLSRNATSEDPRRDEIAGRLAGEDGTIGAKPLPSAHMHELSLRYDAAASGVLVLARPPLPSGDFGPATAVYTNAALSDLLQLTEISVYGPSNQPSPLSVFSCLKEAEPVLLRDVCTHLHRIAACEPTSNLSLYLEESSYSQNRDHAPSATDRPQPQHHHGRVPAGYVRSRGWSHVIVQPIRCIQTAAADSAPPWDEEGRGPQSHSRPGKPCGGVPPPGPPSHRGGWQQWARTQQGRLPPATSSSVGWPAVVVTFQPLGSEEVPRSLGPQSAPSPRGCESVSGRPVQAHAPIPDGLGRGFETTPVPYDPRSLPPAAHAPGATGTKGARSGARKGPRESEEEDGEEEEEDGGREASALGFTEPSSLHQQLRQGSWTSLQGGPERSMLGIKLDARRGPSRYPLREIAAAVAGAPSAGPGGPQDSAAPRPPGAMGSGGPAVLNGSEMLKLREGMVLAAMSPLMITAVSAHEDKVFYQNVPSAQYFGVRLCNRRTASAVPGGALGPLGEPAGVSPLLEELFVMEPGKLAQVIMDVVQDGRVWRGIIQVPFTCRPDACPAALVRPGTRLVGSDVALSATSAATVAPASTLTIASPLAAAGAAGAGSTQHPPADTPPNTITPGAAFGDAAPATPAAPTPPHPAPATREPSQPDGLSALPRELSPQGQADGPGTSGPAAERPAALQLRPGECCSSLLNTALSFLEEGLTQTPVGNADVDPLATSTWGLMLDNDPPDPQLEPALAMTTTTGAATSRARTARSRSRSSFYLLSASQAAAANSSVGRAPRSPQALNRGLSQGLDVPAAEVLGPLPPTGTAPAAVPAEDTLCDTGTASAGEDETSYFYGSGSVPAASSSRTGTHRRRSSRVQSVAQRRYQQSGAAAAAAERAAAGTAPSPAWASAPGGSRRDLAAAAAAAAARGPGSGQLQLARSDSRLTLGEEDKEEEKEEEEQQPLEPQQPQQQPEHIFGGISPHSATFSRRSTSRAEAQHHPGFISSSITSSLPGASCLARVLAFASNLKNTPSAVHLALQHRTFGGSSAASFTTGMFASLAMSNTASVYLQPGPDAGSGPGSGPGSASQRTVADARTCSAGHTFVRQRTDCGNSVVAATVIPDGASVGPYGGDRARLGQDRSSVPASGAVMTRNPGPQQPASVAAAAAATKRPAAHRAVSERRLERVRGGDGGGFRRLGSCGLDAPASGGGGGGGGGAAPGLSRTYSRSSLTDCHLVALCPGSSGGRRRSRGGEIQTGGQGCEDGPSGVGCASSSTTRRAGGVPGGAGAGTPGPCCRVCCWHEVTVNRAVDPVTREAAVVVLQVDVTAKVEAERHLALVSEAEHRLLEQIFPRHILARLTEEAGQLGAICCPPDLQQCGSPALLPTVAAPAAAAVAAAAAAGGEFQPGPTESTPALQAALSSDARAGAVDDCGPNLGAAAVSPGMAGPGVAGPGTGLLGPAAATAAAGCSVGGRSRAGGGGGGGGGGGARDIHQLATCHSEVTLLFADIEGFTPMCKVLEPRVVMAFLNDLFTRFDERLDEFGVYKVETIGDCYFVAGGLIMEDEQGMPAVRARASQADPLHSQRVFMFAKAMLTAAAQVTLPTTGAPVRMRIGIHAGPVVSGLVGRRMPRFCLFGDTVNTASRMESTGVPGCIHASEAAWRLLRKEAWTPTGGVEVKGKGLMQTYLWSPPEVPSLSQVQLNSRYSAATTIASVETNTSGGTTHTTAPGGGAAGGLTDGTAPTPATAFHVAIGAVPSSSNSTCTCAYTNSTSFSMEGLGMPSRQQRRLRTRKLLPLLEPSGRRESGGGGGTSSCCSSGEKGVPTGTTVAVRSSDPRVTSVEAHQHQHQLEESGDYHPSGEATAAARGRGGRGPGARPRLWDSVRGAISWRSTKAVKAQGAQSG